MRKLFVLTAGISSLAAVALAPAVGAQSVGNFYKGKTVTMIIPFSAGGMY